MSLADFSLRLILFDQAATEGFVWLEMYFEQEEEPLYFWDEEKLPILKEIKVSQDFYSWTFLNRKAKTFLFSALNFFNIVFAQEADFQVLTLEELTFTGKLFLKISLQNDLNWVFCRMILLKALCSTW